MKLVLAITITILTYSCKSPCLEIKQLNDESINNYKVIPGKFDTTNPPLISDFRNIPHEIHCILSNTSDTFRYNSNILILGLKLYEYQYYFFHQGYQLKICVLPFFTNRITSELIRITKPKEDYLTPRIAYEYIKNHPIYLKNAQIKTLMDNIELIDYEINHSLQIKN
jgi:hypothetical protein